MSGRTSHSGCHGWSGYLAMAWAKPPEMGAGYAADWTESQISLVPEAGVARVLMHSVA